MKHRLPLLTALAVLLIFNACSPKTTSQVMQKMEAGERSLVEIMTGNFDSKAQSLADTSYFDITLHMVPIWTDEVADYLYVEQALSTRPRSPYRQRVYKVERLDDGSFKSEVYSLPNDSLFIGKWSRTAFFDSYSPDDLIAREGCAVILNRLAREHYSGATVGDLCKSTLYGAAYATSFVEVKSDRITSWDQGFDDKGSQVWGAEEGPYIFIRKKVSKKPQVVRIPKAVK